MTITTILDFGLKPYQFEGHFLCLLKYECSIKRHFIQFNQYLSN